MLGFNNWLDNDHVNYLTSLWLYAPGTVRTFLVLLFGNYYF